VTFIYFRKLTHFIANRNRRKIAIAPDIAACISGNVHIRKLIVEPIIEKADLYGTPRLTCNWNAERRPVLEENNLAKLVFSRGVIVNSLVKSPAGAPREHIHQALETGLRNHEAIRRQIEPVKDNC
jgi:hypothetical protein